MAVQPYLRTLNFPELMDCTEFNILPSKNALRWGYAWPISVIELNATTRSYHSHTLSIKLYLAYVMTSMKRKYFRISHDASPIRMGFVACRTICSWQKFKIPFKIVQFALGMACRKTHPVTCNGICQWHQMPPGFVMEKHFTCIYNFSNPPGVHRCPRR